MTSQKNKETILIVDDNPMNLGVLFNSLDKIGFRVLIAESGEKALQEVEQVQPDLILLDVMMPIIDGFETCHRLKENESVKDIPVIFMTALSDTVNKIKGFQAGGVDYITKPLQHEEVLARINTHLMIRNQKKQLEQEIAERKKIEAELRQINASKDKFFSIIAHDLRGPFTSFVLGTELLSNIENLSKERVEGLAKNLHKSADKMQELLENLLEWARIQMGGVTPHPEKIGLKTAFNFNMSLLNDIFVKKRHQLTHTIQDNIFVYADPNMVNAILRNLLTNACKFTPVGGKIHISYQEHDQMVEISIIDTGTGIEKEDLERMFRIDTSFSRRGTEEEEGTGLGLILCKELIEVNQGKLLIESEVGKGTTVTITLPKCSENDIPG